MKTNKFDETIREKLRGVQPGFTDRDWRSFKDYSELTTRGKFWQPYGRMVRYAAAAFIFGALTAVCGILYYQNTVLREKLDRLKDGLTKTESVISLGNDSVSVLGNDKMPDLNSSGSFKGKEGVRRNPWVVPEAELSANIAQEPAKPEKGREVRQNVDLVSEVKKRGISGEVLPEKETNTLREGLLLSGEKNNGMNTVNEIVRISSEKQPYLPMESLAIPALEKRQIIVKKSQEKTKPEKKTDKAAENAAVQRVKEEKNTLPTFIKSRLYRVGLSFDKNRHRQGFGIVNEFLLGQRVAVTWGLSKSIYEKQAFLTEKLFFKETNQNFRKTFGGNIPHSGEAINISTHSTLLQIPLSLSYRQPIPGGVTLTGGVQTHFNLSFRQNLEYSILERYQIIQLSGLKFRKSRYPVVNNFSPAIGIKKTFDPIVFQAEGFYYFSAKDVPYINGPEGWGGRVKLLYQFGK